MIFSAAWAADPAPQSAIDTYISARDRALTAVKADPAAEPRMLAALDRLIRPVVPAWHAAGFPEKGELTLSALDEGDVGFGALDGIAYARGKTIVVATTKPLLTRWLAGHRDWEDVKVKNLPPSLSAALRTDAFYTQALAGDGAAFLYGLVLVKAPPGADLAIVELGAFAQDLPMDRGPDTLLAVVFRGERVLIGEEPLSAVLAPVAYCKKAMDQTVARAALEAKANHGNSFDALEEKADRDYRACFAQHLREQKTYTAIQKQAQALVDLLN